MLKYEQALSEKDRKEASSQACSEETGDHADVGLIVILTG